MLELVKTPTFEKDVKKLDKKHYKFDKLKLVIDLLITSQTMPPKYKNHYLQGDLRGYQECHIDKDILLIYQIIDNDLILCRLGSHKDLLGK